jgi:predicted dehydrogenase
VVDAMISVAGHIDSVYAMSKRLVLDFGLDDTTSMLFTFKSGASGYLGTVIATPECWRLQVFGSKGWAEMGSVPHLTTWTLRRCYLEQPMEIVRFRIVDGTRRLNPPIDRAGKPWSTSRRSSTTVPCSTPSSAGRAASVDDRR